MLRDMACKVRHGLAPGGHSGSLTIVLLFVSALLRLMDRLAPCLLLVFLPRVVVLECFFHPIFT